jgi:hypothetical protein
MSENSVDKTTQKLYFCFTTTKCLVTYQAKDKNLALENPRFTPECSGVEALDLIA